MHRDAAREGKRGGDMPKPTYTYVSYSKYTWYQYETRTSYWRNKLLDPALARQRLCCEALTKPLLARRLWA